MRNSSPIKTSGSHSKMDKNTRKEDETRNGGTEHSINRILIPRANYTFPSTAHEKSSSVD